MVRPWPTPYVGRLDEHVIVSEALRGNVLGDPHERPLWVYTPPGYDESGLDYPVVYEIQGYTGSLPMWRNRSAFRRPFPDLVDDLMAAGQVPPVIVVYVDAWTSYGGSQYVDSPGTGNYHTYLCDEVVPFVDARYRTLPDAAHRAIQGKSSGGFGAMITPMLRPDLFGHLATHAGDSLYEYCYLPEFAHCVRFLRPYDGDIEAWWRAFGQRVAFTEEGDAALLMLLGCSAAFSARPDGTPELPFDPRSGVLRPAVWSRWLEWDPVRMVDRYAPQMRGLHSVWIDAGVRDEWYLDLGATAFRDELVLVGVSQSKIEFELFDASHMAIEYRYPRALEALAYAMSEPGRGRGSVPSTPSARCGRGGPNG